MIYQLRGFDWDGDTGIFRHTNDPNDWTDREGATNRIRAFNQLVGKADKRIALSRKGFCAAFNVAGASGNLTQVRNIGSKSLTYQTWDGSPAFALEDTNGDLILMNLTDGNVFTLDPSFVRASGVSVGLYDENNVWREQYTKPFKGNTLLMWKGEVARVLATNTR